MNFTWQSREYRSRRGSEKARYHGERVSRRCFKGPFLRKCFEAFEPLLDFLRLLHGIFTRKLLF